MNKSGRKQVRLEQKKGRKSKANEYADQQQQNFDALQLQEHNDDQYNTLLKSSNTHGSIKKNAYFFNNQRYGGSKQPLQDQSLEQAQDSPQDQNQIAGAIKAFQEQRKKQSKLLVEDVRRIEQQDKEYEILRKRQKTSDDTLQQAVGLRDQLNCQRMLIQYRYNEQTTLQNLKRFPNKNYPYNQHLHSLQKQLESHIFKNLNILTQAYQKYSQGVFNTSSITDYQQQYQAGFEENKQYKLNGSSVHQSFMNEQEEIVRNTEKQLVKWSQKTSLINISSSHYSSLLMQTPVGQTKKILTNWERVKGKCQHKRNIFKILFEDEENVRETSDPQIFDDFQLFAELQKNFISSVEDEKDFRVSDTLRYLKSRQNRQEKSKQVDRKASKNRKIRFNVHPKLLNFLPSHPGNLIEARDQIVQNFFNCKARQTAPQKVDKDGQTYFIDM